jgi:hypothetical protein
VDDRKNLPEHEVLIRRVSATPQNQFAEFTEKKLLYHSRMYLSSMKLFGLIKFAQVGIQHRVKVVRHFLAACIIGFGWVTSVAAQTTPSPPIFLYFSPTTDHWLQTTGQSYEASFKSWRRYLKKYGSGAKEVDKNQLLAIGSGPAVLILPNCVALDSQEREAITRLANRGVSLFATGWLGTRNEHGALVGNDFLHQTFNVKTHGTFQSDDGLFMLPFGDGPLTWPLPAGRRMDLGDQINTAIRVESENVGAVMLGWDRIMDQKPHGVLAFNETSASRQVFLGLTENVWPVRLDSGEQAMLDAAMAWLRRQPQAFKAAWPNGYQAAHLIEMDTEDKYYAASNLADHLEKYGFRGTFYSLTSEVVRYPDVARDLLKRGHEIAYHADVHYGFGRQPVKEQELRIQFMIEQMRSVIGDRVKEATGFRAPTESYDVNTEALLRKYGLRHHAADPAASEDRLPFFSIAEKNLDTDDALVVLPRTQWDDVNFTYLRIPPDMVSRILEYDLNIAIRSGGFSLLSVHSQYYIDDGLMNGLMEPYIRKVATFKDRLWVARGDAITQWWRDRAKVQVRQSPATDNIGLSLKTPREVKGVSIFVTLPRRNAQVIWKPDARSGTAQYHLKPIDPFRTALIFDLLPPGETQGKIEFQ